MLLFLLLTELIRTGSLAWYPWPRSASFRVSEVTCAVPPQWRPASPLGLYRPLGFKVEDALGRESLSRPRPPALVGSTLRRDGLIRGCVHPPPYRVSTLKRLVHVSRTWGTPFYQRVQKDRGRIKSTTPRCRSERPL